MKRLLPLILCAAFAVSSCGLLGLTNIGSSQALHTTPFGTVVNPVVAAASSVAPNPSKLTAQEDPGTGLYGYLNEYGVWVIAPTFEYAVDFNSDLGLAVVKPVNGRWGAINVYAQTVIQFSFRSRYDVESAMRSIQKGRYLGIDLWEEQDPGTELWGYLDYYGNWYIQPQYWYATGMNDQGLAVVQFPTELWGAIDRKNNIIIQPNFKSRYDAESALRALMNR